MKFANEQQQNIGLWIVAGVLTVLHLAQPIHLLVFAMSAEELYRLCLNLASLLQQLVRSAQRLQLILSIFLVVIEGIFVLQIPVKLIMVFWCTRGKEISYPASYSLWMLVGRQEGHPD